MIPVLDLGRMHRTLRVPLQAAFKRVLGKSRFILGEEVRAFEREFSLFLQAPAVVGVASGTEALAIALRTHTVGPGDEVIIPANALPTIFAVTLAGCVPRLCDVDPATANISPTALAAAITKKTKAVIVVHLYGNVAPLDGIINVMRGKGIVLIEDCAQAAGARYKGRRVGTIGNAGCFSFYPTKNIGGLGDGGAIALPRARLAAVARAWRQYGEHAERYRSSFAGWQSRLDELQAAFLRVKLPYLNNWNKRRRAILAYYQKTLKGLPVRFFATAPASEAAPHLAVIVTPRRDELAQFMHRRGIGTALHYPLPIHRQRAFRTLFKGQRFIHTERLARTILTLPLFPELSGSEVKKVSDTLGRFQW